MASSSDFRHWEPGEPLPAERISDVTFWPEDGREIELLIMEVRASRSASEQMRVRIADLEQQAGELTARLVAARERVADLHNRLR